MSIWNNFNSKLDNMRNILYIFSDLVEKIDGSIQFRRAECCYRWLRILFRVTLWALKSSFLSLTMKVSGCGGSRVVACASILLTLLPVWSLGLKIDLRVGSLQGRIEKVSGSNETTGKNYASFSSIPYAEPPIGKLRFKVCIMISLLEKSMGLYFDSNYTSAFSNL